MILKLLAGLFKKARAVDSDETSVPLPDLTTDAPMPKPGLARSHHESPKGRNVAYTKTILCLANSRKHGGHCLAGKEIRADGQIGGWIRPVRDREYEEISESERQYEDGSAPRVLDVIDVPLLDARPKDYQQENWLLDPERHWHTVRRFQCDDLAQFTDKVVPLWNNGYSTANGWNNRIAYSVASSLDRSLRLIKVNRLELFVSRPGNDFGNYRQSVQ